ncbi:PH domain-containing protein [Janibacter sp. G1551]|uniref:PH domain-containing protein n=1 Tax=Janibacter sp. G1551 TaxID=3420440 RepID=UPI003D02EA5F
MARRARSTAKDLDRFLLEGERLVGDVRRHRIVLAKPVLLVLAATAVAIWGDMSIPDSGASVIEFLWWAWFASLLYLAFRIFEWRQERFVATDKRLLLFYGFITRKVAMMPLTKVTDMTYHRTIPGRVLGYGKFVLESAGQEQALSEVNFIPRPDRLYKDICAEIFGTRDADDYSDEDNDAYERDQEAAFELEHDVHDLHDNAALWRGGPPPGIMSGHRRGRHEGSLYRSADLRRRDRDDDTGELPVVDPDRY